MGWVGGIPKSAKWSTLQHTRPICNERHRCVHAETQDPYQSNPLGTLRNRQAISQIDIASDIAQLKLKLSVNGSLYFVNIRVYSCWRKVNANAIEWNRRFEMESSDFNSAVIFALLCWSNRIFANTFQCFWNLVSFLPVSYWQSVFSWSLFFSVCQSLWRHPVELMTWTWVERGCVLQWLGPTIWW